MITDSVTDLLSFVSNIGLDERSEAALCLMAEDFRSGSEKWMMLISIRDPGHRKYVRSCANRFSA